VSSQQWDALYRTDELVWASTPNQFLVAEAAGLPTGRPFRTMRNIRMLNATNPGQLVRHTCPGSQGLPRW